MNAITTNKEIQEFVGLLTTAAMNFAAAGKYLAERVDENPDFISSVCDKHPEFTEEALRRIELVGRGKLHPQLMFSDCPGVRRLRKLPYSIQETYCSKPVELLIQNGETLQVSVFNLLPEQAEQVFAKDEIRSLPAQRLWLESKRQTIPIPPEADLPYRIVKDKLVVLQPCQIKVRDLARIVAEMQN